MHPWKSIEAALGWPDSSLRALRLYDPSKLHQLWEENHLRRVIEELRIDCVFDVGANYGQYAKMLRHRVGFDGLIVSFEPMPEAAAALRREAAGDPLWQVEELAISSSDGEQAFQVMASSQFSSLSEADGHDTRLFDAETRVDRRMVVKTELLDTAYSRLKKAHRFERPFLKMDTQGFDVTIVRASGSALREFLGLQSELAIRKIYRDSVDFRDALAVYESRGFRLSAFVPNNAGHFPQLVEMDCIMLRDDLMAPGDGP